MTKAEVNGEYEKETGKVIVARFSGLNPNYTQGVLVKNHGPLSPGVKMQMRQCIKQWLLEQVAKNGLYRLRHKSQFENAILI